MNAIQPVRRNSPSVIAWIPALSWSAIASRTALSSRGRAARPRRDLACRVDVPRLTQVLGPQQTADDVRSHRGGRHSGATRGRRPCARSRARSRSSRAVEAASGWGWPGPSSRAGMRVAIADIRPDHIEQATAELGGEVHALAAQRDGSRGVRAAADETEFVLGSCTSSSTTPGSTSSTTSRTRRTRTGTGCSGSILRRNKRRRHVRAEDQGTRPARPHHQHGEDGELRRRPGRRHLHHRQVRRPRPHLRAPLEPVPYGIGVSMVARAWSRA